jgi:hypothetical protein
MSLTIRDPRNFWVGALFTLAGAYAVLGGREHAMGSAGRMGPAYFPTILGGLLLLVGLAAIIRSTLRRGDPLERFHLRELALVTGSVVGFALILQGAGLAPAVVLLVMGSGYASREFHVGRFALLAVGLALFAGLVFVKGLGMPVPMFGTWFGA